MHDWVSSDIGLVVHKHEPIKRSQESCGLRAISIEFIWVDTLESACFVFLIVLRKIFERKRVISSAARSARRFVACCLRGMHSKGSEDIFVSWFVFIIIFIAGRIIKWSKGSCLLLFLNCLCCGYYSFCKWHWISRFRWSFSTRWWSGWYSSLFKKDEVNPREWVIFKSEFVLSQLKTFKFVFLDAYFKPYAIDIADRH